ncbi:MAG: rod shape-determining protein, partial [Leptotrichiaceae bacterium]
TKFNLLIGDRTAERIKKQIGTAIIEETPLTMQVKGRDLLDGIPKELTINSNEVREAIIESINLIVSATKEVLEKCPPELAADILDNGIILTGGGSLVRNLDVLLEAETQIKVTRPENPLESVVLGAGFAFDNKKLLRTLQMKEN